MKYLLLSALLFFVCLTENPAKAERVHTDDHVQIEASLRGQLAQRVHKIPGLAIGQISMSMDIEEIVEMMSEQGFRHVKSSRKHQFDRRGQEVPAGTEDTGEYIIHLNEDQSIRAIEYKYFQISKSSSGKSWSGSKYAGQMGSYMTTLCAGLSPSPSEYFLGLDCPTSGKIEENDSPFISFNGIESAQDEGAVYTFTAKTYAESYGYGHEVEAHRVIQ